MKQSLSYNKESSTVEDMLSELIAEIASLKIELPEDQLTLTEAQVFFNGGIESAIKNIRKKVSKHEEN
jgi:uncharacterized protein (DUF2164 family)